MPFDFAAVTAPFRMQPGLRKLGAADRHLTPNAPGSRALREKLAVLTTFWPQALAQQPGFDARPALDTLAACAAREHPQAWRVTESLWQAQWLGWGLDLHRLEPEALQATSDPAIGHALRALPAEWRRAGLLCLAFADDFAVLDRNTARVPWVAVCLPSGWAPERQVGRHFAEIHAPVADNETLVAAGAHLARLVGGPDRWERFVWTLTPHPRLHRHPDRTDALVWPADADAHAVIDAAFLRTERQTFLPVAREAQAIFTIHVEVKRLGDAVTSGDEAQALHDALASMSPAVLAYRGLTHPRDRLLEGLSSMARMQGAS